MGRAISAGDYFIFNGEAIVVCNEGYKALLYVALSDGFEKKPLPPTPAKGDPMPQTREYWEKRADMDQELILKQRDEISALKQKLK